MQVTLTERELLQTSAKLLLRVVTHERDSKHLLSLLTAVEREAAGDSVSRAVPADNWGHFLHVRRILINQWRIEGKTCTEIAHTLSMDPGQVYLISQVETGVPPQDAMESVIRHQREVEEWTRRGFSDREEK